MAGDDQRQDSAEVGPPTEEASAAASKESSLGDVPGAPTPPIQAPGGGTASPPQVGLNWAALADRLRTDRALLERAGCIVITGEYFPESGFFVDPETLTARHVDVGDFALRPGYFLGDMVVSEFQLEVPLQRHAPSIQHPIMRAESGPIIGLFSDPIEAERVRQKIIRGSLGTGVTVEHGPLGVELRVNRPELLGRVATVIASRGGAVISVGGRPLGSCSSRGPMASRSSLAGEAGDALRPGTGVTSDSEGPEIGTTESGPDEAREFRPS